MQLKDPLITTLPHRHLLNPMQAIRVSYTRRRNQQPIIHRIPNICRRQIRRPLTVVCEVAGVVGGRVHFYGVGLGGVDGVEGGEVVVGEADAVFVCDRGRGFQALMRHYSSGLSGCVTFASRLILDKAIHGGFS